MLAFLDEKILPVTLAVTLIVTLNQTLANHHGLWNMGAGILVIKDALPPLSFPSKTAG